MNILKIFSSYFGFAYILSCLIINAAYAMEKPSNSDLDLAKLNAAIDNRNYDELRALLDSDDLHDLSVQDAFVHAAISKDKGSNKAMQIIEKSFKKYKTCKISGFSSKTGNTALHEVVAKKGMQQPRKIKIINYLLEKEPALINMHNANLDTPKELLLPNETRVKNVLNSKKNIIDSNRFI